MAADTFKFAVKISIYEQGMRGRQDEFTGNDVSVDLRNIMKDCGINPAAEEDDDDQQ